MADKKISAMTTLANPPLARVFDAVITNDGTTTTNFQRPQGVLVQQTATGTDNGLGIQLQAGAAAQGTPGDIVIQSGNATTNDPAAANYGQRAIMTAGSVQTTDTAWSGTIQGGYAGIEAGFANAVVPGYPQGQPAAIFVEGGIVAGSTATGGYGYIKGGSANGAVTNIGGNVALKAGGGADIGGNAIISPGAGMTNGVLLVNNIGTVDPHVLNAKFQTSIAGVGYVGVYSKG